MASGLWPAVSGAAARANSVDTVANNLANVNTDGFKKDEPTFREYLTSAERENAVTQQLQPGPIKDKDFYPLDGRDQSFVITDSTYTNFRQGNLKVSHSPLDVAIEGPGFLEVNTPAGIRYTRQGSLKMTTEGQLVTTDGYPVLASQPAGLVDARPADAVVQPGQGGQPTQGGVAAETIDAETLARFINIEKGGPSLTITPKGEIYSGDRLVAQLSVKEFIDLGKLRKNGGLLFENPDPLNFVPDEPRSAIRQGMIETSNVNPVDEVSKLIRAHRMFEHDLKAIKTYDSLMEKEANSIGRL